MELEAVLYLLVVIVLGELVEMVLVHKLHLLQELVEQVDH